MSRLSEVVPDAVLIVHAVENMSPGIALLEYYRTVCGPLSVSYFVHLAGHYSLDAAQTMRRQHPCGPRLQLGEGQLTSVVNGHK